MSVTATATTRLGRLKLAFAWTAFSLLRFAERVLPLAVLSLLLWPPAAAWDLVHLRRRKLLTWWRRFPQSWHPRRVRFFLLQSLGLIMRNSFTPGPIGCAPHVGGADAAWKGEFVIWFDR